MANEAKCPKCGGELILVIHQDLEERFPIEDDTDGPALCGDGDETLLDSEATLECECGCDLSEYKSGKHFEYDTEVGTFDWLFDPTEADIEETRGDIAYHTKKDEADIVSDPIGESMEAYLEGMF